MSSNVVSSRGSAARVVAFFFGVNNAAFFLNLFYVTFLSLLLTILTAPFYDAARAGAQDVPRLAESR